MTYISVVNFLVVSFCLAHCIKEPQKILVAAANQVDILNQFWLIVFMSWPPLEAHFVQNH